MDATVYGTADLASGVTANHRAIYSFPLSIGAAGVSNEIAGPYAGEYSLATSIPDVERVWSRCDGGTTVLRVRVVVVAITLYSFMASRSR